MTRGHRHWDSWKVEGQFGFALIVATRRGKYSSLMLGRRQFVIHPTSVCNDCRITAARGDGSE